MSVQFNSSLIHVLRLNGNKLSKLFEKPEGPRQREKQREEGAILQLLKQGSTVTARAATEDK